MLVDALEVIAIFVPVQKSVSDSQGSNARLLTRVPPPRRASDLNYARLRSQTRVVSYFSHVSPRETRVAVKRRASDGCTRASVSFETHV